MRWFLVLPSLGLIVCLAGARADVRRHTDPRRLLGDHDRRPDPAGRRTEPRQVVMHDYLDGDVPPEAAVKTQFHPKTSLTRMERHPESALQGGMLCLHYNIVAEGTVNKAEYQLPDYTRALMVESEMVPASEIEDRLTVRSRRHAIFERPNPPRLLALIDEQVLTRMIGGPAVMHRQLDHLANAAEVADISVEVISNSGGHAGANGAFVQLRRDTGHKVVYLETSHPACSSKSRERSGLTRESFGSWPDEHCLRENHGR